MWCFGLQWVSGALAEIVTVCVQDLHHSQSLALFELGSKISRVKHEENAIVSHTMPILHPLKDIQECTR